MASAWRRITTRTAAFAALAVLLAGCQAAPMAQPGPIDAARSRVAFEKYDDFIQNWRVVEASPIYTEHLRVKGGSFEFIQISGRQSETRFGPEGVVERLRYELAAMRQKDLTFEDDRVSARQVPLGTLRYIASRAIHDRKRHSCVLSELIFGEDASMPGRYTKSFRGLVCRPEPAWTLGDVARFVITLNDRLRSKDAADEVTPLWTSRDPEQLLEAISQGTPGACSDQAWRFRKTMGNHPHTAVAAMSENGRCAIGFALGDEDMRGVWVRALRGCVEQAEKAGMAAENCRLIGGYTR